MKTKLQNFLVYNKIDQNIKKQEPLLLEDRRFYVYALLDPRFNGARMYRDLKYVFNHMPIYFGKGYGLRYESHFKEADDLWEKPEEIKKYYNPIKINKINNFNNLCKSLRRNGMKIKENCSVSTSDFWYDLTDGGYLNPEEILEDEKDVKAVNDAIKVLMNFKESCGDQIEEFYC